MQSKWKFEMLQKEALKYKTRVEFQKNSKGAYLAAYRRDLLDQICTHMRFPKTKPYTFEELKVEALNYKTKGEFRSTPLYHVAHRKGLLDQVCSHMTPVLNYWTDEELIKEALKYTTRTEFSKNSSGYQTAHARGILDQICSHMKILGATSIPEKKLFDLIKEVYSETKRLKDRRVSILNKPYIHGMEIDIYIPNLNKGIEFDGRYWHSIPGLKRSHPNWPEKDLRNYHQIKDDYFLSKGIQILHINEIDWLKNRESCLKKCLTFLST